MSHKKHHLKNKNIEYSIDPMSYHRINDFSFLPTTTSIDQAANTFVSNLSTYDKMRFNGRLERGILIVKSSAVTPNPSAVHNRQFQVRSSDGVRSYLVDLDAQTCECPDHFKGHFCKHRVAAHIFELAMSMSPSLATSFTAMQKPQPFSKVEYPHNTTIPFLSPPITLLGESAQGTNHSQAPAVSGTPPTNNMASKSNAIQKPENPNIQTLPNNSERTSSKDSSQSLTTKDLKDAVVWGVVKLDGKLLGVEILSFDGDRAMVRALPKITDEKKLQPQFPFPGKKNRGVVAKNELIHVKIFV